MLDLTPLYSLEIRTLTYFNITSYQLTPLTLLVSIYI